MTHMNKQPLLDSISDAAINCFVYDRKNDEELSVEDVEKLIESGKITLVEIVSAWENAVIELFPKIKDY